MKITCEIKNQVPYSSFTAIGLVLEGDTLTLFFGQLEKKILVRPSVVYMDSLTAIIEAEEEMLSGTGKLPPVWRIRVDYE